MLYLRLNILKNIRILIKTQKEKIKTPQTILHYSEKRTKDKIHQILQIEAIIKIVEIFVFLKNSENAKNTSKHNNVMLTIVVFCANIDMR